MQTQNGSPAIPDFLQLPDENSQAPQPAAPNNGRSQRQGGWTNSKFNGLKYDWYTDPFTRANTNNTQTPGGGDFLILPSPKEKPWYQEIEYIRFDTVADLKPQFREATPTQERPRGNYIEFPLLTNWGVARKDDPIAALSLALYKKYNDRRRGGYPWFLTKRRYLFLVAFAKPELQAAQKAPQVLELPGDRRDHIVTPNAVKSVGYTLATMPDERIIVESHPNYGQPKYGYICHPNSQPIISVRKQMGSQPQDFRYAVDIATPSKADWVALQNRDLLFKIKPLLDVVHKPTMEYLAMALRSTVEPEIIQELIPEFASDILGTNEALGMPQRAAAPAAAAPAAAVATPTPAPAPPAPTPAPVRQTTMTVAPPVAPAAAAPTAPTPPPSRMQSNGSNGTSQPATPVAAAAAAPTPPPPAPAPVAAPAPQVAAPTPTPAPVAPPPVAATPAPMPAPAPAPVAQAPMNPVEMVISRVTHLNLPASQPEIFGDLFTSLGTDMTTIQAFGQIQKGPEQVRSFLRLVATRGVFDRWLPFCAFD